MEISQSQFQTTDFNYGLVEGSQGLVYKKSTSEDEPLNNIFATPSISKQIPQAKKKKPQNRFNIFDSEYLEDTNYMPEIQQEEENVFAAKPQRQAQENIAKAFHKAVKNIPVFSSIILKGKSLKLQKAINGLNEINQNVDSIISNAMPYGEENKRYSEITKNLSDASNLLGQAKKEIE